METWMRAGWVLTSNGHVGVVACSSLAEQQWRHGCVVVGCWSATDTRVCAGWVLISYRHIGACLLYADQQWRQVCAGWVLINNEHMGVCLLVTDQQWTRCVLGWRSAIIETWVCAGWLLIRTGDMSVRWV